MLCVTRSACSMHLCLSTCAALKGSAAAAQERHWSGKLSFSLVIWGHKFEPQRNSSTCPISKAISYRVNRVSGTSQASSLIRMQTKWKNPPWISGMYWMYKKKFSVVFKIFFFFFFLSFLHFLQWHSILGDKARGDHLYFYAGRVQWFDWSDLLLWRPMGVNE